MPNTPFTVVEVDIQTTDDATLAMLVEHQNKMLSERFPDDPPRSFEERSKGWRSRPAYIDLRCWAVWNTDSSAIIANAWVEAPLTSDNRHLLDFNILVLPQYRRQGLGSRLLAAIADYAHQRQRRLLCCGSSSNFPSGALFLERIGAKRGLEMHTNQLVIDQLDTNIVRTWIAQAVKRAPGFELGFWEGAYPTSDLSAIAHLLDVMNTAPRGTLDREDIHVTPEKLQQAEQSLSAQGAIRWTAYVRERETGTLAGFSTVLWHPQNPIILEQGDTGVLPAYRNQGLGRWLKAAMLDKILRERPQVRFVRTGNADTNAPMLKINRELGFKPYTADAVWQIELTEVQQYLRARNI